MTQPPAHHGEKSAERGHFRSILFGELDPPEDLEKLKAPEFFSDLNIDQIVESVTAGRDEYNLKPFFYIALDHIETIEYRQDVFRDLENPALSACIRAFAQEMRTMRRHLAQAEKLHYKYQKQAWFLAAVDIYCRAARRLIQDLVAADVRSPGLRGFREYLIAYTDSTDFLALVAQTDKLRTDLSGIKYSLHIDGKCITVSRYNSEPDYGADVLLTFDKFKQGAGKQYRFKTPSSPEMDHVEAGILDLVARLHPKIFASLEEYSNLTRNYLDITISLFDQEIEFYLAWLQHIQTFRQNRLPFCYPDVTERSKEVFGRNVFDLALANRLTETKAPLVTNDFFLRDRERIIVVTGPNQGGKTTFARSYGQLHYLASIGCPVPGTEARLFLFDKLFTHFEREENIHNLSGKLEDDLLRIHHILESATPNSILIMNESFVSTALNDALFLSKQVMERIARYDMLCVTVTFLDELASFSDRTVSMVSTVDPLDPALRTFKIVRKPADGLAYAGAIAEKYHLTRLEVRTRIAERTKKL